MPKFPIIFENIDSQDHLQSMRNYLDSNIDQWGDVDENNYWQGRTLFYNDIKDHTIKEIMINALSNGINHIKNHVLNNKEIYCEHLSMARWPKGYQLTPHADAQNPPGQPEHEYPWRDFALITFLNDNFDGGTLYFPDLDIKILPKPGYSIYFPGTLEYLHGVTEITAGTRYTIASFLTYDEKHHHININEISV